MAFAASRRRLEGSRVSSVYEALQRARQGQSQGIGGVRFGAIPLRPHPQQQRTRRESPPPAVSLAPGPLAVELTPLLAAVRPLLDGAQQAGSQGAVLQFVAATPGEGASTVAREFAFLAATTGRRRSLLIDADRRNPQTARGFGCATGRGLIDGLWEGVDDAELLHPVVGTLLSVVCLIGERGPAAADAETLREVYDGLRDHFELVVVDCPSVASGLYADLLPEAADGVILVIQAEKTRPAVISHAKNLVQQAGGTLIGAVLNKRTNYIPDFFYRRL